MKKVLIGSKDLKMCQLYALLCSNAENITGTVVALFASEIFSKQCFYRNEIKIGLFLIQR